MTDRPTLVTGAAGFIGFHVAARLLAEGHDVVGIDNLNTYYDPALKQARLAMLLGRPNFEFQRCELADGDAVASIFERWRPSIVCHLAAQAGVRHSLSAPRAYVQANVTGFLSVLEGCRSHAVDHLIYASSSSVYGSTSALPFSVHNPADHPVSLYAATKRANELMAHSYSHLFGIPSTGLRFFSVYGPYGRPDMAYYAFTEAITSGREIHIYGDGSAVRDFTYIDDIVESIWRLCLLPPRPDAAWSSASPDLATSPSPWRIYNIGHGEAISVNALVDLLEELTGRVARRVHVPEVPGDVPVTHADTSDLAETIDFVPTVALRDGLARFVAWYLDHATRPVNA